jgi:aldose sugar dehydrogenase
VKHVCVAMRVGGLVAACVAVVALDGGSVGFAQQPAVPGAGQQPGAAAPQGRAGGAGPAQGRGGGRGPVANPLGDGPWEFGNGASRYRVTVVTKGLDHPWGIAFLPDGDLLVTERPGRLRVIRKGVLDPTPIAGLPQIHIERPGVLGGLLDVALHPKFAENRLLYFAYSKGGPKGLEGPSTTAVGRGRWDGGSTLTDVKDVFVADAWHGGPGSDQSLGPASGSYGSRLAFDKDGLLYVTVGDRNYGKMAQEPGSDIGKILRIRDDGTIPPDNPFVGKAGYKPEIYSLGHRNQLGLYFHPVTGDLWSTEEGPQGGDELNLIKAGRNYGWMRVSLGRNYDGSIVGEGFSAPGIEDPVVFWVPAIAISGLSFYDGDKFPAWKGQAFVGAMRGGTGQFVARVTFNAKGQPTGRDHSMLADLKQRIREVKPGPDGLIYVLTDETAGAVLRIEPPQPQPQPQGQP